MAAQFPAIQPLLPKSASAVANLRWVDAPDRFHNRWGEVARILDPVGVDTDPLHITPASGTPLWGVCKSRPMLAEIGDQLPAPGAAYESAT